MSLVPSLLQAVIGLDGEALVIHVGEKPYVVAPSGQVELATRALTFEAVTGILEQMLPGASRQALEEFGAVQYELPPLPQFRNEHFTVVAARGGDDVWVEVRRRRTTDDDLVPADMFETPEPLPAHDPVSMQSDDADLALPNPGQFWPERPDPGTAQADFASIREMPVIASAQSGDLDLPDSIEIDPPFPRRAPVEAPKAPKVTLFPIQGRPAPPAPASPRTLTPVAAEEPSVARGMSADFQELSAEFAELPPVVLPAPRATSTVAESASAHTPVAPTPPQTRGAPASATLPPTANWPTFEVPAAEITRVDEGAAFEPVTFDPSAFELPPFDAIESAPVFKAPAEPTNESIFVPPVPPAIAPPTAAALPPPARSVPEQPAAASRQPITPAAFIPPPSPELDEEPQPEPEPFLAPPPPTTPFAPEPVSMASVDQERELEPHAAVVLPISRVPLHGEPGQMLSGLDRLLRVAAARGASTLYVASKARPSI